MIVIDASAIVSALMGEEHEAPTPFLDEELHAPHLVDIEVAHALRRLDRDGSLEPGPESYLRSFKALRIHRYPHERLLPRVWALRHNLSAYDAAYVALAEALRVPLVTTDSRLAAAPGHGAQIELVA